MSRFKIKPQVTKSLIREAIERTKSSIQINDDFFVISFKHLDKTQGSDFHDWEKKSILAHAMDVLEGYCCSSLRSQLSTKFTIYGHYPANAKSGFKCPDYIPEDAEWARIHVTGLQFIIGHVVKNIFYVVFLDEHHEFYKSELKHT